MNSRLVIIDIGSHKLEELSILLKPGIHQLYVFFKWTVRKIVRIIFTLDFNSFAKINKFFRLLNFYFIKNRSYDLQIISIEPNVDVVIDSVKRLGKKYPIHYLPLAVLGHDSEKDIELKKLYFYDHSISSSIYDRGREIDESKSTVCVGMRFGVIWDQLKSEKIINDEDQFILRMNCEGSELGVISDCQEKQLKPICVIGSLGDVLKIHGVEANNKISDLLSGLGTPYYYFKGELPDTWHAMIEGWERHINVFLNK
jgi:hypothetical protein